MARGAACTRFDVNTAAALAGWSAELRKEALRRAGEHALWAHLSQGFQSGGLDAKLKEKFAQAYRDYQASLAVEEIDDALKRIDDKTYGYCERCFQPIPKPRLRALPYARLCVACKSGGLSRR